MKKLGDKQKLENINEKLNILWTNDNPEIAHSMVFMYATNSKLNGWWEYVDIIIWGPTAKLVAEDKNIQEKIKMAQHVGVNMVACIACANQFGVVNDLQDLNINVKAMGEPLTELIKNDERLITI
ncbi:MAG: DsrE family protein [bacterium]